MRGLLLLAVAALAACASLSVAVPPPSARVRLGPASAHVPHRALALPATCTSPFPESCIAQYPLAVDSATRSELEFAGYVVVDGERVNPFTRERVEQRAGDTTVSTELTGGTFRDASPAMQREVLDEMNIDTIIDTVLVIGAGHDINGEQYVEVTLSAVRVADSQLVWGSHCVTVTGLHNTLDQAVDLATRCATDSAFAVRNPVEQR